MHAHIIVENGPAKRDRKKSIVLPRRNKSVALFKEIKSLKKNWILNTKIIPYYKFPFKEIFHGRYSFDWDR